MAEDALACFQSLLNCIPVWITDLEDLASSSVQLQKETLIERQPVQSREESSPEHTDSSCPQTDRSNDGLEETERCGSSNGLLRPQLPHMTASDALRLSQRKRKTLSACSDMHSGPAKYRSKAMVVVYYDGNLQKRFETLVRSIGTSRNSLRKGKISAKVAALSRVDSTSSNDSDGSQGFASRKIKTMSYRTSGERRARGGLRTTSEETESFDKADGLLEKAQNLCERAAHQVLRDGDCSVELKQANGLLVEALVVGDGELPKLQRHAERAAARDKLVESHEMASKQEEEKSKRFDESDTPSETLISVVPRSSSTGTCSLEVDTDADESDGAAQFDPHHMRKMRLRPG